MHDHPFDPRHTALVIVDLQNDFLAADGAYARGGATNPAAAGLPGRVAAVADAVKRAGGLVVTSRFTLWPDARGEPMIAPHLKALRPFLQRGDFAPDSRGQANLDVIAPFVDVSVDKVAYSAFFGTQLDWVLRHAGIRTLAFCGIVTNGGVASTVRDAHLREYDLHVLEDGCTAFDPSVHATSIADLRNLATIETCAGFTARLGAAADGA